MELPNNVWLFTLFAIGLILLPGADTALVIRTGIRTGARSGFIAGVGICTGLLFWGVAASLGLSAFLLQGQYTQMLRWAGALLLIYLGINAWITRDKEPEVVRSSHSVFFTGLFVNVLNPKVALFYLAVLPRFVTAGPSVVFQGALLTAIHAGLSLVWFALLMTAFDRISTRILTPIWRARASAVTGTILIAFGIGLALA